MVQVASNKMTPSSPSDKFFPVESQPMDLLELSQFYAANDQIKGTDAVLNTSPKSINNDSNIGGNLQMQAPYYESEKNKIDINSTHYESGLFSSSFSEIFSRKLRLPMNDTILSKPVDTVVSCLNEEEQFQPVKESETQNIGNLLPDEDDLFSGMIDELGYIANIKSVDDLEDFDLFSCGGGFEIEGKEISDSTCGTSNGQIGLKFLGSSSPGLISGCMGDQSIDSFSENVFSNGSLSVPSTSHFPMKGMSVGNQYGFAEPRNHLDQLKFRGQYVPSSRPHSLPEHHNNFPCNSLRTNGDVVDNVGSKITGISSHFDGMVSNRQPRELSGGVLGFGNCSGLSNGHHCNLRNTNSYQHPHSSMIWPNSPTFVNGIRACRPQQLRGFHATSPHMINMVSPVPQQQVGSMPVFNPSIWDRRHDNVRQYPYPKASSFHGLNFPIGSLLIPSEITSHNISHHCMNRMDISLNSGLHPQTCNNFSGMSPILSVPSSYDSSGERINGFSHCRNEGNSSCITDRKQYELDIGWILRGEDKRTTLMLKNIPNKYTSKMLLATIDEHHRGSYDFIYLPIDFKNKCNVGYAFINMIDPLQIVPFHQTFSDKKWEKFNSEKVATLAYARIQGKAALIAHFQNSSLMNEDKRCRPILFHTDGPNAGDQEPFPISSNVRSRVGKARNLVIANVDESSSGSDSSS